MTSPSSSSSPSTSSFISSLTSTKNDEATYSLIANEKTIKAFEKIASEALDNAKKRYHSPCQLVNLSFQPKDTSSRSRDTNEFFIGRIFSPNGDLVDILKELEVKRGSYTYQRSSSFSSSSLFHSDTNKKIPIPNDSLSVHFSLNPRDQVNALVEMNTTITKDVITNGARNVPKKFDSCFLSYLHASQQDPQFVDVDVSTKDVGIIQKLFKECSIPKEAMVMSIETRDGFHFVCHKDKFPATFYTKVVKSPMNTVENVNWKGEKTTKKYIDVLSDVMIPIPGTYQGGFEVKLIGG